MSHYALINDKNIVYQVIYFDNDVKESDIESHFAEIGVTGIKTSYNTKKNKYYGEYSFHYWFWKNRIKKIEDDDWIGFCAYRRFWFNKVHQNEKGKFQDKVLNEVPEVWKDYDVILGDKIRMNQMKWIKIIKYGKISLLKNPKAILRKNQSIKFQFDMFHGNGILDQAINVLDVKDRNDFKEYVNTNCSFNQGNMFICKSKTLIEKYYE